MENFSCGKQIVRYEGDVRPVNWFIYFCDGGESGKRRQLRALGEDRTWLVLWHKRPRSWYIYFTPKNTSTMVNLREILKLCRAICSSVESSIVQVYYYLKSCRHGLEGDFTSKGLIVYKEKLGISHFSIYALLMTALSGYAEGAVDNEWWGNLKN